MLSHHNYLQKRNKNTIIIIWLWQFKSKTKWLKLNRIKLNDLNYKFIASSFSLTESEYRIRIVSTTRTKTIKTVTLIEAYGSH